MHQGLPPTTTNCTENCLLYRWLRSACQRVKKMNRSQAGDGFFLPPSFTFSVNLDFNSQKKKGIRDTPKQLISTLISQFCFTLKSTSFSQEETGVETCLHLPPWPTRTSLTLCKNSGTKSLYTKRKSIPHHNLTKKGFLTWALGEKDQRGPDAMLRHQKLMCFGVSRQRHHGSVREQMRAQDGISLLLSAA